MRSAIVLSTWNWETFNVPERLALALALRGFRVLFCEMPVSRFGRVPRPVREVHPGLHVYSPEYLGAKFANVPLLRSWQWTMVARQIQREANLLGMKEASFLYSHIDGIAPLCREMRLRGSRLIHVCMDYPEPYQYDLIGLADRTLVIPKTVFHKLRARYGEKIFWIPQSNHSAFSHPEVVSGPLSTHSELASIPRPRLGYLGPIFARINLPLLRGVLRARPQWQFICFGDTSSIDLPNAHSIAWRRPDELASFVASFDVGVMPYDCFEEKNLHCVPLKLFDYFAAGLPVVSTPVLSLTEVADLVYLGDTATEFVTAIEQALAEGAESPKRHRRREIARTHSIEALGQRLEEVLSFTESENRSSN
jgi:glycosyltransferase involved in cell wall biosynthesis